jgi:hypothetical protein
MKRITLLLVAVLVLGTMLFYLLGSPAPKVSLSPDAGLIAAGRALALKLDAGGGGLKKLSVTAVQGEKTVTM